MVAKKSKTQKKNSNKSQLSNKSNNSKAETKLSKRFLHDVEFNLHVIIYLFGINIILICVVLFYVSQLQVLTQTQAEINEQIALENEQMPFDDFTYYKYTKAEFANIAGIEISTVKELEKYALEKDYDTIVRKDGYFHGEKEGSCINDITREERRCKKLIVEYDERDADVFEVFVVREYQFDLEETEAQE